ncbi:Scr1 family TA system antitoxin-like transcriptional regulator [Streptomyces sp. NEAU-W12]|uniref:Scr1 family TA system antitoxin-like transcriptional regulator n=1 Tax=Streptomyces sp. NEAU-W12 TaxID=2994668 RepID=UPI003A4C6214
MQTRESARAMFPAGNPSAADGCIGEPTKGRPDRTQVLEDATGPAYGVAPHETVPRASAGGPAVTARRPGHTAAVTRRRTVLSQMPPLPAGARPVLVVGAAACTDFVRVVRVYNPCGRRVVVRLREVSRLGG